MRKKGKLGLPLAVGALLGILLGAMVLAHYLFQVAGRPENWPGSILFVLGIMTTTGYFPDVVHNSWLLVIYSLFLMLLQVAFLVVILPLFLREWLGEFFESRSPTELSRKVSGHVLVCGYNSQAESLLQELEDVGQGYAILLNNRETVLELSRSGIPSLWGDPGQVEALERANLSSCQVLVAVSNDQENIRTCLAAKRSRRDVRIIALAELVESERVLSKAGAEAVVAPKLAMGNALAVCVISAGTLRLDVVAQFHEAGDLVHLKLGEGSRLSGMRVGAWRQMPGILLGVWTAEGIFRLPTEEIILGSGMILAVVASPEDCSKLARLSGPDLPGYVVVAGMGDTGREMGRLLSLQGIEAVGLSYADELKKGDARRSEALLSAGIHRADAYVLAMDNDDNAIYSALLAREMAHAEGWKFPIVARANHRHSVEVMQAAEVDEVFCLADVADVLLSGLVLGRYVAPVRGAAYRLYKHGEGGPPGKVLASISGGICTVRRCGGDAEEECLITLELTGISP